MAFMATLGSDTLDPYGKLALELVLELVLVLVLALVNSTGPCPAAYSSSCLTSLSKPVTPLPSKPKDHPKASMAPQPIPGRYF